MAKKAARPKPKKMPAKKWDYPENDKDKKKDKKGKMHR